MSGCALVLGDIASLREVWGPAARYVPPEDHEYLRETLTERPEGEDARFVLFYRSLVSDWNHGNAHFLRGIVGELMALGQHVKVFEPANGWSLRNLREQQGDGAQHTYAQRALEVEAALCGRNPQEAAA
jgi:hypothetical protein